MHEAEGEPSYPLLPNMVVIAVELLAGIQDAGDRRAFVILQSYVVAPQPTHYPRRVETQEQAFVLAQRLLASTDLLLAQVAAESGFGNQSYFTRVFTSRLRVTPRAYR